MGQTAKAVAEALRAFDGVRTAPLKALVQTRMEPEAVDVLVAALPGPDEIAATWCLKALAETGRLPAEAFALSFAALPELSEPDAILHTLQMVQHAPDLARPIREAIVPLAGHPKLLVTVWAFDAYCRTTPAGEEADRAARIRQGLTHRSKAMQARARALAREFGVNLPQ